MCSDIYAVAGNGAVSIKQVFNHLHVASYRTYSFITSLNVDDFRRLGIPLVRLSQLSEKPCCHDLLDSF